MSEENKTLMQKLGAWAGPFIIGAAVGAIALGTIGGFDGQSHITTLTNDAAEDASLEALVPICVANAQAADPAELAAVLEMRTTAMRRAIGESGWAIYPADVSRSLKSAIDRNCADALNS